MTKEDLYEKLGLPSEMYKSDTEKYLDEFFESNAVIPKGENRHLCADVIHAYAEGINNIEVLRSEGWVEFKQSGMCLCIGDEYRIKPSEPVWEYQWIYGQRGDSPRSARLSEHCTIDELFTKFTDDIDVYFFMPAEETKRERK